MLNRLVVWCCVSLLWFAANASAAPEAMKSDQVKIGVVDIHAILKQLPETKRTDEQLQKEFKPRQQKLSELQKKFQADVERINRERAVMSDSEREKLSSRIEQERADLMRQQQLFQDDLTSAQRRSMEKLLARVQLLVSEIARRERYDMVFQKESLPYSVEAMDITAKVIRYAATAKASA